MPIEQCKYAHRRTDTPVIEGNNICAGGEEGTSSLIVLSQRTKINNILHDNVGKPNVKFILHFVCRKR